MSPSSLNLLNLNVPDASGLGFNPLDLNAAADWFVPLLVRGSLAMFLAMLLVRWLRPRSLLLRRLTCVVVLMHGWLLASWTIEIPWYDPPAEIAVFDGPAELPSVFSASASSQTVVSVGAEAATPVSQSIRSRGPWRSVRLAIFAIWSIGIVVAVSVQIHGYRGLVRASRRWREAPEAWARTWSRLSKAHCVSNGWTFPQGAVPLRVSLDHGPMLCRLAGQTCLVIPEAFWSSCDEAERSAVLQHELSHWRHRDIEKTWAVGLFALPYWFHPAAWWSLAEFRQAAELRCDAEAASTADERGSFLRGSANWWTTETQRHGWLGIVRTPIPYWCGCGGCPKNP